MTFELGSKEHAQAIERAVDGRNDMIHAIYTYTCEQCGMRELIGAAHWD